jgi:hypothetical protein
MLGSPVVVGGERKRGKGERKMSTFEIHGLSLFLNTGFSELFQSDISGASERKSILSSYILSLHFTCCFGISLSVQY